MDVIVVGAGAVGGAIGAGLARAGHHVGLVARGAHLQVLQERGLRLETPDGAEVLQLPAAARVEELGFEPDVVFVATKVQDFAAAAAGVDPSWPVVCATNGVEAERLALRRFHHVLGCMVATPAEHLEPGLIRVFASPLAVLDVGRWPSGVDPACEALASALRGAGFLSEARADVAAWKYGKLLSNLGNALQAACGPEVDDPELLAAARAEAGAVFAAAGVTAVPFERITARMREMRYGSIEGAPRGGGSTWQSLRRGSGVEVDWLNGEIALLGRLHGVPTPVNVALQQVVSELARAGRPPGSVSLAEVRRRATESSPRPRSG
ncbi:MAG: 2-dehydropantoate 2-reductase N-terminal domain-containing protein [Myxococcota bacterium]